MRQASSMSELLTRTPFRLEPDPSRTICRLFVPGQETLIRGESRAMAVIDRVLDLSEEEVERAATRTLARFSGGYRDLAVTLERNFQMVAHRLGSDIRVGQARRQLIGAYFSQEYALVAPPLFNPSLVAPSAHAGCQPGSVALLTSLRSLA